MMYLFAVTALLTILAVDATPARAQSPWDLEVRGGLGAATADLGDADLGPGVAFQGTVSYRVLPHLAAFAGWGWARFFADQSFAGPDIDAEETGYIFGLRFVHPMGSTPVSYVLQAGGVYNHIEIESASGGLLADPGHGLGFDASAGLRVAVFESWQLAPSIGYRSLSRDVQIGTSTTSVDLQYVSMTIGFVRTF